MEYIKTFEQFLFEKNNSYIITEKNKYTGYRVKEIMKTGQKLMDMDSFDPKNLKGIKTALNYCLDWYGRSIYDKYFDSENPELFKYVYTEESGKTGDVSEEDKKAFLAFEQKLAKMYQEVLTAASACFIALSQGNGSKVVSAIGKLEAAEDESLKITNSKKKNISAVTGVSKQLVVGSKEYHEKRAPWVQDATNKAKQQLINKVKDKDLARELTEQHIK